MTGTSTPATPPLWQWRLMGTILVGMAAGFLAARALGWHDAGIQSAIVAALTFAAGGRGRLGTAVPVALVLGVVVVVFSTLGALTIGSPVAGGLAMAFVAFTTSVMTAARPVGLLVGMVASYAYFLVTAVGVLVRSAVGRDITEIGLLGALGLLMGLGLVVLRAGAEQVLGTAPARHRDASSPSLLAPMVASVRTFDGHAKDGVRRAIALGVAMFAFQSIASHSAFWIMLTVFVILSPSGRSTLRRALIRVTGTFVGVMSVLMVAPLLPASVAVPIALLCLALSLAASTRSSTMSAALGAAAASVLAGLPHDDILGFAGERLLDTIIGAALALAAGYLLWPHSKPPPGAVPVDLAGDAGASGIASLRAQSS